MHIRIGQGEAPELGGRDQGEIGVTDRHHPGHEISLGERGDRPDPGWRVLPADRLEPVTVALEELQCPLEQAEHPLGRFAGLEHDRAGLDVAPLRGGGELGQPRIVQVVEQVDRT